MKKYILIILSLIMVLTLSQIALAEENVNKNENEVNVNVNIENKETKLTDVGSQQVTGFGVTTPIVGKAKYKEINGEFYTTEMSGLNLMMGYTSRTYFGNGLPADGGAGYFEYGTMVLIAPYIGVGYTYRINKSFFIDVGVPNVAIGFTF